MTIIAEDGTGKPDAESYFDRDFFLEFCTSWGLGDQSGRGVEDVESAMRRGTLLFDSVYGPRFLGAPVSLSQALVFPMTGLVDCRSYMLPPLPVQVKQASAVLTLSELNSPMSLFPTVTPGKVKKSIVVDKIEVEYDVSDGNAGYISGARPVLALVESILSAIGGASAAAGSRPYYGSVQRG